MDRPVLRKRAWNPRSEGTAPTFDAGFLTRSIPLQISRKSIHIHTTDVIWATNLLTVLFVSPVVTDLSVTGAVELQFQAPVTALATRVCFADLVVQWASVDWLIQLGSTTASLTSRDRRQDGASRACAVRRRQTNDDVDVLISKLLSTWSSSSPPPAAKTLMYDHRPRRRRCLVATAAADDYVMLMITVLSIFFSHHKRILSSICLLAALSSSGARCVCSSTVNHCLAVMITLLCCTDSKHTTKMWYWGDLLHDLHLPQRI